MRDWIKQLCIPGAVLAFTCSMSLAQPTNNEDKYNADKAFYDLRDREKLLLGREDQLGRTIFDTKQKINYLTDALDDQYVELGKVRHDIVVTRLQLMR